MTAGAEKADVIVVGAGIVGLATARELLIRHPGTRVIVLEKEPSVAHHQSGHNSGVIHAGLYYAAGSLKARLCRLGRELLLRFADEQGIPYRIDGKLVVAKSERELPRLAELKRRGQLNGLSGLRELDGAQIREVEPHVVGVRALHVPETGSIDFALVTRRYADDVNCRGGEIRLGEPVVGLRSDRGCIVETTGTQIRAARVLTCAGVQADRVAHMTGIDDRALRVVPFRGNYYELSPDARALVRGHIYPVPDPTFPFLGVHFSRRIDGQVWAGPNALPSLAREEYRRTSVRLRDLGSMMSFPGSWRLARRYARTGVTEIWRDLVKSAAVREMQSLLPELDSDQVRRGAAGIRAQLVGRDGSLVDDFRIERAGPVLHVLNAPSPAATASLAIAQVIANELESALHL